MAQQIPVPRESLEVCAIECSDEIGSETDNGRPNNARSVASAINKSLQLTRGSGGEYVSVPASVASTVCSWTDLSDPETARHSEAIEHYLRQYNVW